MSSISSTLLISPTSSNSPSSKSPTSSTSVVPFNIENGLSSLMFLSIPIMFEIPYYVTIGFVVLTLSSILFHIFPAVNLFGILDTSSIIYICSLYSFTLPMLACGFTVLNILEKTIFGRNSGFTLMFIWIYTFVYCTIYLNIYTLVPMLFSLLFYHYTYFLNGGNWDKRIRLLWHFYNALYIAINTPYKFKQI